MDNYNNAVEMREDGGREYYERMAGECKAYLIEELRKECMSFCLETYLKIYPKITNYLMDRCRGSKIKSIYDLLSKFDEDDFEFAQLLMDEMRDDITDDCLIERIEASMLRCFRVKGPLAANELLYELRDHIFSCVEHEVKCIIDECNDYLSMGYEDMLEQRRSYF